MKRRNFLIGAGGAAIGASVVGTGAFSRVESHRSVTIAVAEDADAYLGLRPLDTPNSQNYVALDENGHIYVQIDGEGDQQGVGGDGPIGQGVNSNSVTYFDGMFEICNQGKADATVSYELPDDVVENDTEYQTVTFYYMEDGDRVFVEDGEEVPLALGECEEIGIRTITKGVAAGDGPLIDGDVVVTADSPDAGASGGD